MENDGNIYIDAEKDKIHKFMKHSIQNHFWNYKNRVFDDDKSKTVHFLQSIETHNLLQVCILLTLIVLENI